MSVLSIVTYNDPILRTKAEVVPEISQEIEQFVQDMVQTMYHANGLGLAAPQVGRSLRIFVFDPDPVLEDDEPDMGIIICINPVIVSKSEEMVVMDEGCLSLPELNDKVKRSESIVLQYRDLAFNEQELPLTGWPARIVLHEMDHLDGVLFIDHLSSFRRRMHRAQLSDIEAGLVETTYPLKPKMIDD
jgi:peptide deformylase